MKPLEFTYRIDELGLSPEVIEERIGYEPGGSPEPVRRLIEETLYSAQDHCDIRGGYVFRDDVSADKQRHKLNINGTELDVKKIIYGQLIRSEAIAAFLCTAGNGIGVRAEELTRRGDFLEGYIMDAVGSEIVEAAMDKIQDDLEQRVLADGLRITDRYSPGYCGWNVSEQQKLFSLFPDGFCGVTLTPHSLMQPIKSVSGIIGIGHQVSRKGYACNVCEMADCIYRNKDRADLPDQQFLLSQALENADPQGSLKH